MPDISMCDSEICKTAHNCYRHERSGTKPSKFRQSYFFALNWTNEKKGERWTCAYYVPVKR